MIIDIIVALFASVALTNAVWYYAKWKSARDYNTYLWMKRIDALELKRQTIDKACELLCKTCNIGVCGEDQKCHRYKGFRKAMEE